MKQIRGRRKHSAKENWLGNGLMLKFSYVYHATRGAGLINIFFIHPSLDNPWENTHPAKYTTTTSLA